MSNKELLDAGADVNAKDNRGRTALRLAQQQNYPEIVELLCAALELEPHMQDIKDEC